MKEKEIKDYIVNELSNFKFVRTSKGYKYLIESILICIKKPDSIDCLNKNVFPILAIKYNAMSYIHIKWCIEQSIKTMYNNTNADFISNYFKIDKNIKPSLKFFIYTIISKYEWKYGN